MYVRTSSIPDGAAGCVVRPLAVTACTTEVPRNFAALRERLLVPPCLVECLFTGITRRRAWYDSWMGVKRPPRLDGQGVDVRRAARRDLCRGHFTLVKGDNLPVAAMQQITLVRARRPGS